MAKKQFFAIIDSETTIENTVADFATVICDRQGIIHNQMAVLVKDHYDKFDLFYDSSNDAVWSKNGMLKRRANYDAMLADGRRMMASVAAINKWIAQAIGKYNPILTAYNLPFDEDKARNTGIDLNGFSDRFCLWAAATGTVCNTKAYRQFVLENHLFNPPTELGNMSFKTNAECVAGFLAGGMRKEPHCALEDIIGFELPALKRIVNMKKWREHITHYNWRMHQVKDHFIAK